MEKTAELVFMVDGSEMKIKAKLLCEVFDGENGAKTAEWESGRKVVQDRFEGNRWVHKKVYSKEGNLDCEITRVFDDEERLISICEDRADGSRDCTIYEYDDRNQSVHQKTEIMRANGKMYLYERWYSNFYDGNKASPESLKFDKNICYREFDEKGRCVHFIDSDIEGVNEYFDDRKSVWTSNKGGVITRRKSCYESDDGLVSIQKSENLEEGTVYYEYKDSRSSVEFPNRLYALYSSASCVD